MSYTELDYNTIKVGDDIAIDTRKTYVKFIICKVMRVTKTQIEVRTLSDKEFQLIKFSKITRRELNGYSWHDRRLCTVEYATKRNEYEEAAKHVRIERSEIKTALKEIAEGSWTEDTVTELTLLAERIKQFIG